MRGAVLFVMFAGAIGATSVTGCAVPDAPAAFEGSDTSVRDDDDKPAPARRERPTSTEPTDTSGVTPTVPTSAKTLTTWKGRAGATPATEFGGDPFCNYAVALSNIELSVTLDADGRITATELTNTMTETTPSCPSAPLGVQQNKYAFRANGGTPADELGAVVQLPDPTNLPLANVSLTVARIDDTHASATLVFQRVGGASPTLNWTVPVSIDLAPPGM